MAAKNVIHEPFLMINADDYYGKEDFQKLHDYMVNEMSDYAGVMEMCMAGFILSNTLSDNGGVTYKDDKPAVAAIRKLTADGIYPEKLFLISYAV